MAPNAAMMEVRKRMIRGIEEVLADPKTKPAQRRKLEAQLAAWQTAWQR